MRNENETGEEREPGRNRHKWENTINIEIEEIRRECVG
jgi:hypothetical protein